MQTPSPCETATLQMLRMQIDDMCSRFGTMRNEMASISANSQMPDATLHLQDVLKCTEDATLTILDATMAVSAVAETAGMPADCKEKLSEQVGIILQACGFQDISGQRIKKVLGHLGALESQLVKLSEASHGQAAPAQPKDSLLNGPQLEALAPTQADIDSLFGATKV